MAYREPPLGKQKQVCRRHLQRAYIPIEHMSRHNLGGLEKTLATQRYWTLSTPIIRFISVS